GHLVGDEEVGEDKIEKEAKEQRKTPQEIAEYWQSQYFQDLKSLDILKPDISPRATEHISEMIDFIKVLIKKGFAYEVLGNVYFEVKKFTGYGQLSGRRTSEEEEGKRVQVDQNKKNPIDFVLWLKADKNHLQKWPSPWGEGYPGWHLECSVMSAKYLGQPFDIHGSANEHIFPHHENEIAQSEAYAGMPLANFWVHSGMLTINGQKMAKSAKNYVTIKDALKEADKDTIKIAFMGTHWKKPFNWSEEALKEARIVKDRLARASMEAQSIKTGIQKELNEALENDFNIPVALSIVLNNLSRLSIDDFEYIKKVFGLKLTLDIAISKQQEEMVKDRNNARDKGDYKEADKLRTELEKEGIILEDTPSGTRIIKISVLKKGGFLN
ncbi:MAG: Cysteine--tRNA ligase, partial [Candidatus Berkelbacteria bacterium]|nr:Cysteine--tRNA ligase [Candidatus Berkelbacteria bacterium]